jgi:hypothetical protein
MGHDFHRLTHEKTVDLAVPKGHGMDGYMRDYYNRYGEFVSMSDEEHRRRQLRSLTPLTIRNDHSLIVEAP